MKSDLTSITIWTIVLTAAVLFLLFVVQTVGFTGLFVFVGFYVLFSFLTKKHEDSDDDPPNYV